MGYRWLQLTFSGLLAATCVNAAPLDPNDILISIGNALAGQFTQYNTVYEFTPSGSLVQTIPFNYNGGSYPDSGIEYLRDVVVAPNGSIYGYNGTFAPYLTAYSPLFGTFTHTSYDQWNTTNGPFLGGIGAFANFVFATDMGSSTSTPSGIVRFDTLTNSAVRFGNGIDFEDLNVGLDGRVYGAYRGPFGPKVNVYDPVGLTLLRTVNIPDDGAIAVDQFGKIFFAVGGTITRFSSTGAVEATLNTGISGFGLSDIDVNLAGAVIATSADGKVVVTNSSLSSFTTFTAISDPRAVDWTIFGSFASPVPEPSTFALLLGTLPLVFVAGLFRGKLSPKACRR